MGLRIDLGQTMGMPPQPGASTLLGQYASPNMTLSPPMASPPEPVSPGAFETPFVPQSGGLMGLTGADINRGLTAASPLLMALGQNLTAPPGRRDPRLMQAAMGQMQQQAQQAQDQQRRQALGEAMRAQLAQLPPEQRRAFGALMQADPEKAAEFLARMQVAQAGRAQQTVNVGGEQPSRYLYGSDAGLPAGWRIDTQTGEASAIPGGPAALDIEAEAAAKEGRQESRFKYQGVTFEDITRGIELVEGQSILNPVTGIGGLVASVVPGSNRSNYDALAETITANVSFDRLAEMRQNSPTGGAVGQLSDDERKALGATLGSISAWQDEDQLIGNLKRLQKQVLDAVHGEGFWREMNGTLYLKTPRGWMEVAQ